MLYSYQCVVQRQLAITVDLLYEAVCLSALFGWSDSQPWLHGSTSDLLDVIAMSWHDEVYF